METLKLLFPVMQYSSQELESDSRPIFCGLELGPEAHGLEFYSVTRFLSMDFTVLARVPLGTVTDLAAPTVMNLCLAVDKSSSVLIVQDYQTKNLSNLMFVKCNFDKLNLQFFWNKIIVLLFLAMPLSCAFDMHGIGLGLGIDLQ